MQVQVQVQVQVQMRVQPTGLGWLSRQMPSEVPARWGDECGEQRCGSQERVGVCCESDTTMVSPPTGRSSGLKDCPGQGLQFTDFSKYLGDCMDIDEPDRASFSLGSDTDPHSGRVPEEDPYGWDAVLYTKFTNPFEDTASVTQQRRGSRSKRSLLQRVLSTGGLSTREPSAESSGPYSMADDDAP
jgi:hypothetical protein